MDPIKPQPLNIPSDAKSLTVQYRGPLTRDEVIGQIPEDTYNWALIDTSTPDQDVIRSQPILDVNGQPRMGQIEETLDVRPYSSWKRGFLGGAVGAVVGGVCGAIASYFAGDLVTFAVTGAALGGAATAAYQAHAVRDDAVEVEWQLSPVTKHKMVGYDHTVMPNSITTTDSKGNTSTITAGYHHYYSEKVEEVPVGKEKYWKPVVKHSSDL